MASVVRYTCWINVVSLAVGTSFALSTGPLVQNYLVLMATSEADSLYGSAYQDAIARFLGLKAWLAMGLQWQFVCLGIITAFAALQYSQPRAILRMSFFSSMLGLCILDLIYGLVTGRLTIRFLIENGAANLAGSVAIGVSIVTAYTVAELAFQYSGTPAMLQRYLAGIAVACAGILSSALIYLAILVVYKPVTMTVSVIATPPVKGTLAAKATIDRSQNGDHVFNLIPAKTDAREAEWIAPGGSLQVSWQAHSPKNSTDLRIQLLKDCRVGGDLPPWSDPIIFNNVLALKVWFDADYTEYATIGGKGPESQFHADVGEFAAFNLTARRDSEGVDIQQFVDETATLTQENISQRFEFQLSASPLSNRRATEAKTTRGTLVRRLNIEIGERRYVVALPPPNPSPDDKLVCGNLALSKEMLVSGFEPESGYLAGVRIRLDPHNPPDLLGDEVPSLLSVRGASGWLTVGGATEMGSGQENRIISFLGIYDASAHVFLDGSESSITPLQSMAMVGRFSPNFLDLKRLTFEGVARAVWKNQRRVSPTRWERMDDKLKGLIATLVLAALTVLGKLLRARTFRNQSFKWLVCRKN